MEALLHRMVENLFNRLDGPLHFRFIIQPIMAIIFAVKDGMKDAKAGKPAYLWAVLVDPKNRKNLLLDGWKQVGKIFILAVILDIVYQLKIHHAIYMGELLIVAFLLAFVPYVLLRGPVNRLLRMVARKKNG